MLTYDSPSKIAAYQRAVHDQKLAMEISAAKRERDFYLSRVDKSKAIFAMKERKEQRAVDGEAAPQPASEQGTAATGSKLAVDAQPKRVRGYGQRKPKADSAGAGAQTLPPSLLSLIAGKPKE